MYPPYDPPRAAVRVGSIWTISNAPPRRMITYLWEEIKSSFVARYQIPVRSCAPRKLGVHSSDQGRQFRPGRARLTTSPFSLNPVGELLSVPCRPRRVDRNDKVAHGRKSGLIPSSRPGIFRSSLWTSVNHECHWPFPVFTLFESRWLIRPSHNLISTIAGEPEFFSLQSVESPVEELLRKCGNTM